jgi:hypothetical protein
MHKLDGARSAILATLKRYSKPLPFKDEAGAWTQITLAVGCAIDADAEAKPTSFGNNYRRDCYARTAGPKGTLERLTKDLRYFRHSDGNSGLPFITACSNDKAKAMQLLTKLIDAAVEVRPHMEEATKLAKSWTALGKPADIFLATLVYSLAVIYQAQTGCRGTFSGKEDGSSPFEKFVGAVAEAALPEFKTGRVKNAVRRHTDRCKNNVAYRTAFQKDVVASQAPSLDGERIEAMAHLNPAHVVELIGV